ncbi:MAG: hypothetical protein VCF24_28570 [Candidatus Latescibacterota bacterium]
MNRDYWDGLAAGFHRQVMQVSDCDTHGAIAATARRLRGRRKMAVDFGCGPDAVTRVIAPFFGTTLGVDYASRLLEEARRSSQGIRHSLRSPQLGTTARSGLATGGCRFLCECPHP